MLLQCLPKYTHERCSLTMSCEVYSVPVDFPSQIDQLPNRGFEITFLTLKEKVHIGMLELKEFNLPRT